MPTPSSDLLLSEKRFISKRPDSNPISLFSHLTGLSLSQQRLLPVSLPRFPPPHSPRLHSPPPAPHTTHTRPPTPFHVKAARASRTWSGCSQLWQSALSNFEPSAAGDGVRREWQTRVSFRRVWRIFRFSRLSLEERHRDRKGRWWKMSKGKGWGNRQVRKKKRK